MNRYRYTPPHTRRKPQPFPTQQLQAEAVDWLKVVAATLLYVTLVSGLGWWALNGGARIVGALLLVSLAAAGVLWACCVVGGRSGE